MTDHNMQQSFNLDRIGKKMPYGVPQEFFSQLESSLNEAAAKTAAEAHAPTPHTWRWVARTALTAAAVVAVILSLTVLFPHNIEPEGLSVEQAFSNLSSTDQEYILDTFRNDMIIDY